MNIRSLKRLIDSNELPWTPPLPPWADPREHRVRRLRQIARRVMRRRLVAERGWGAVLVQSGIWPAMAALKAALATKRGNTGAGQSGIFDLWVIQLLHNIQISDQRVLGLESPDIRALAGLCFQCREHQVLLDLINCNTGRPEMEDKRGFARFCSVHQLPTVEILAESNGREITMHRPLPRADLFLKPSDLGCGKGISKLPFHPVRKVWLGADGVALNASEIPAYAQRLQAGHPWILQMCLRNSPTWSHFSSGALCTVRIVTGREHPNAPVEIIGAFMRFPCGDAIVDNFSTGGLAADCEIETGRLGRARNKQGTCVGQSTHPDTGAPIEGVALPEWNRVCALALRAHEPIKNIAMVGWDIALPGAEPVLVEMNLNWGLLIATPLGCTRYLEIMGSWLEKPSPAVASFISRALES